MRRIFDGMLRTSKVSSNTHSEELYIMIELVRQEELDGTVARIGEIISVGVGQNKC